MAYTNSSNAPNTTPRTASFQVNDGSGSNNLSNLLPVDITVVAVNDAPTLANLEAAALAYTENDPPTAISATLTVADADSPSLTGATVSIAAGYQNGQDVLGFTNQLGITGSFNSATGVLTLTGTTTRRITRPRSAR